MMTVERSVSVEAYHVGHIESRYDVGSLSLSFALVFVLVGLVFIFSIFPLANAITASATANAPLFAGFTTLVVLGVIFALALAVIGLLLVAWQLGFIALATGERSTFRAIAVGFSRTFTRKTCWRSLLVGVVAILIAFLGSLALTLVAGLLAFITQLDVVRPILGGIGSIVLNGIISAYFVAYAFDMRVRQEGQHFAIQSQEASMA